MINGISLGDRIELRRRMGEARRQGYVWHSMSLLKGNRHSITGKGRHRLIMPQSGGFLLTGECFGYGYFTLPYAESDQAADDLMREMLAWHRCVGSESIQGPVANSIIDLNKGGMVAEPHAMPGLYSTMPACCRRAILRAGFPVSERHGLYRLDRVDMQTVARVSGYAARRFGVRVVCSADIRHRDAVEALSQVSRDDIVYRRSVREWEDLVHGLGRLWSWRGTQIAFHDDEPIGYLIALKDRRCKTARLASVQVLCSWHNRAITAMLLQGALNALAGWHIDAGVINDLNLPSKYSVERAGGRLIGEFEHYFMRL